ncbi:tRNA threonylcarbamoyladenosine dehydratase [Sulfurimonas sp. MAG313]|nr:tRNA threonylcarbamoyladenosine dehydratase [Sulfurimonas sp. MAG313]
MLLGEDFDKLAKAKILLLGVGGVGSFCLDCLYRNGITDITIIDFDSYDESNQNRQMWSELHNGESKVESLQEHYPQIHIMDMKITPQWVNEFDFEPYDLILDAIDDIHAKLALAQRCYKKLISATGSAKRLDPTKVEVSTIWKTHGDRFASKIRYELKKRRFTKKYPVIFSTEPARVKVKGSFVGVTGAFGMTMCSLAIKRIIGE